MVAKDKKEVKKKAKKSVKRKVKGNGVVSQQASVADLDSATRAINDMSREWNRTAHIDLNLAISDACNAYSRATGIHVADVRVVYTKVGAMLDVRTYTTVKQDI